MPCTQRVFKIVADTVLAICFLPRPHHRHEIKGHALPVGRRRCFLQIAGIVLLVVTVWHSPVAAQIQTLPKSFVNAAQSAGIPLDAFGVRVLPVAPAMVVNSKNTSISWQEDRPMIPASLMKLPVTLAALELLGPTFTWNTPVFTDGFITDGVLHGSLYIQGRGSPKLWLQHIWLLLRQIQRLGILRITGDIVLDQSAFTPPENTDPAAFDGAGLRPYNTLPQALSLNFNALTLYFYPDIQAGVANVRLEPPLSLVQLQTQIPLSRQRCKNWHNAVGLRLGKDRIAFKGYFPSACGDKTWVLAHPDPAYFTAALLQGLWQEMGGTLNGQVRSTKVPPNAQLLFEHTSAPLAQVLRDVNKFSNNLMIRQIFLTLGLQDNAVATTTLPMARQRFIHWWQRTFPHFTVPVIDNGSGLSLDTRITPKALMAVLQRAWNSPFMPEFFASLPILGLDGTLKKNQTCHGCAHLKSGSFPRFGVYGLAGYVHGKSGQNYLLVVMCNHPKATRARPAFDALIRWLAAR